MLDPSLVTFTPFRQLLDTLWVSGQWLHSHSSLHSPLTKAHIFDLYIPYVYVILPLRWYKVSITGLHPVVTRFLKARGTSNNWWRKMEKGHQPFFAGNLGDLDWGLGPRDNNI